MVMRSYYSSNFEKIHYPNKNDSEESSVVCCVCGYLGFFGFVIIGHYQGHNHKIGLKHTAQLHHKRNNHCTSQSFICFFVILYLSFFIFLSVVFLQSMRERGLTGDRISGPKVRTSKRNKEARQITLFLRFSKTRQRKKTYDSGRCNSTKRFGQTKCTIGNILFFSILYD